MQPLVRMVRDPAVYPPPHTAEVAPSMVQEFATVSGWRVAPDQPDAVQFSDVVPAVGGRVAILCPGPSLPSAWSGANTGDYQHIIAVNRAAHLVQCDWWCALDASTFSLWGWPERPPRVGLCGGVAHMLGDAGQMVTSGLSLIACAAPDGCQGFSSLAAIGFAFEHLQAESVDLFGADMSGAADFAGEETGGRTAARWKDERAGLAVLRRRYAGHIQLVKG